MEGATCIGSSTQYKSLYTGLTGHQLKCLLVKDGVNDEWESGESQAAQEPPLAMPLFP